MIPSALIPVTFKDIVSALTSSDKYTEEAVEQELCRGMGCNYAVLTYSGQTAIHVLLKAYGLEDGDEVIVPSYMCEGVVGIISEMGLQVKFVDVDLYTWNISLKDLERTINQKTRAILAASMFGNPCPIDKIEQLAESFNAVVIDDAAQAFGAEYQGKKVGTSGHSGILSFGRGKCVTSLGGGAIITNDKEIADKSRMIIKNFKQKKAFSFPGALFVYWLIQNPAIYGLVYRFARNKKMFKTPELKDIKYRFQKIKMKLISQQISISEKFIRERIKNAVYILRNLAGIKGIILPAISEDAEAVFLRFPVYLENNKLDEIIRYLKKNGIDAPVFYPYALNKLYGTIAPEISFGSNAEKLTANTVVLPTHPCLKEHDLEKVVEIFKEGIRQIYEK